MIKKRMIELAEKSFARGIILFTDFMNLEDQSQAGQLRMNDYGVRLEWSGGYPEAERKMAAVIPNSLVYEPDRDASGCLAASEYPFSCLLLAPRQAKFSEDLGHRDFMGAILSLGLDRSMVGDILVRENSAFFFLKSSMTDFLAEELKSVRHTAVEVSPYPSDRPLPSLDFDLIEGSLASVRLDSLIALAFRQSRASMAPLISEGRVYVNSKSVTSNGCSLKENDLISVRGFGKFRFQGVTGSSKKNRSFVRLQLYR